MNENKQLGLARDLAKKYHAGQVDKAGENYFTGHIIRVVYSLKDIRLKTIAYLHDIVEDTDMTIERLAQHGFDNDILVAVHLLTKDDEFTYAERIDLISHNYLAKQVKIADIKDHLRDTTCISDSLINRYEKGLKELEG